MTDSPAPKDDIIFRRPSIPLLCTRRADDQLALMLGGGANANHEMRTFYIPISTEQYEVLRSDYTRHVLLWSALLPLADATGTEGPLDEDAAARVVSVVLGGTEQAIEHFFQHHPWYENILLALHADTQLLAEGKLFQASGNLSETPDWSIPSKRFADRQRAEKGVYLDILDAAVLKYTGQYVYRSGLPGRHPSDVDPELLPQVMDIIFTAEAATAGRTFPENWREIRGTDEGKALWKQMSTSAETAVSSQYPDLENDTVRSVAYLITHEASRRAA